EALESSRNSRLNINEKVQKLKAVSVSVANELLLDYRGEFIAALEEDLNMSKALAVVQDLLKSDESPDAILATVLDFDKVLGLRLDEVVEEPEVQLPPEVSQLLQLREHARKEKDFNKADKIRDKIIKEGFEVLDTANGQIVKPIMTK
ncbi:hypothetical protein KC622_03550, partial [Candidatus Dojkabacteria bacterium]|nr:hypothetical protein [Candidatus Dojkabacteria bacterium]